MTSRKASAQEITTQLKKKNKTECYHPEPRSPLNHKSFPPWRGDHCPDFHSNHACAFLCGPVPAFLNNIGWFCLLLLFVSIRYVFICDLFFLKLSVCNIHVVKYLCAFILHECIVSHCRNLSI